MSTFAPVEVACPHCAALLHLTVAQGVNGGRSPKLRDAILTGTFQRFTCSSCDGGFVYDAPFIYVDFSRRQWIASFPRAWERRWWEYEGEASESFERNLGEGGPQVARQLGEGFTVRTVFGLSALAEKIRCLSAQQSDMELEIFKLSLMLTDPKMKVAPELRPLLREIDSTSFTLAVWLQRPGGWTQGEMRFPLLRLPYLEEEWEVAHHMLQEGSYVDTGRVLMPRREEGAKTTTRGGLLI